MAEVYHDVDAHLEPLLARRIGIVGYGSQGYAHALNLRDSGCEVRVGLRPGSPSQARAEADHFAVGSISDVSRWADVIALLLPDQYHQAVYDADIAPHLESGNALVVAHGFSVHYRQVRPSADVDVILVAPVGPGQTVRRLFLEGRGVPAVFAAANDRTGQAEAIALAYAKALGCTRVGAIKSTFQEETETDLFGEQAVLCGGIPFLIRAGFETLVAAGYQPEIAFFECVHQVKLIVDIIHESGFNYLYSHISDTAEFGAYRAGPAIAGEPMREAMRSVLRSVEDGSFARDWIADYQTGMPELRSQRSMEWFRAIDAVGERLRRMDAGDSLRPVYPAPST